MRVFSSLRAVRWQHAKFDDPALGVLGVLEELRVLGVLRALGILGVSSIPIYVDVKVQRVVRPHAKHAVF